MGKLLLKLFVKDYKSTDEAEVRKQYGLVASFFGLVTNFILFSGKIIVGIFTGLYSLISDSVNNLGDFGNNALSIFGTKLTYKPADKDHPYGHQRTQYVVSLIIAIIVIAFGAVMAYQGIRDGVAFFKEIASTGTMPKTSIGDSLFIASICVLSVAILIKITQASIYFSFSKAISSLQLKALGKDALNDCISTALVIIGLLISYFTSYNFDCFFSILVSALVIVSGFGILKEAANLLIGEKPSKELIGKIASLIGSNEGVLGIHDLEMHEYGAVTYSTIHVEVDAKRDVIASHEMCDELEKEVFNKLKVHLTIHMDPILVDDPETKFYEEKVLGFLKRNFPETHIHDFRIVSGEENVNLIFDMVAQKGLDDEDGHKAILDNLGRYLESNSQKKVHLVVNFDPEVSDLLSETIDEK